jgi:hypothetical protein
MSKIETIRRAQASLNGVTGNRAQYSNPKGHPSLNVKRQAGFGFKAKAVIKALRSDPLKLVPGNGLRVSSRVGRMPRESRLMKNRPRSGTVTDVPDLKTDKELSKAVELTHNTPLDPEDDNSVVSSSRSLGAPGQKMRTRKAKGLRPPRKLTRKGGMTFTSMKNLLVDPKSDLKI